MAKRNGPIKGKKNINYLQILYEDEYGNTRVYQTSKGSLADFQKEYRIPDENILSVEYVAREYEYNPEIQQETHIITNISNQ